MIVKPALAAMLASGLAVPENPPLILPKPAIVKPESLEVSRHMLLGMPLTMGMLPGKGPPPTPLVSAYGGHASNGNNLTSYSFASMSIGTAALDRYVLVYAHTPSGAPITSVTVGGAATTVLGQDTGNGFFLTNAPVTSGTTATVVISCATQALRGAAYTWSVTGRPALTEYMTGTSSSLNVAANGAAFAVCILASGADDAATWTGLTERHESYFDAITNITAASDNFATAQVSRTLDVTWTTAGNDGNVRAVSLRPT